MVSCRDFVLLVRALIQPFSDLPYDQPAAQPPAQLLALRVHFRQIPYCLNC